jgi:hypothetical protein
MMTQLDLLADFYSRAASVEVPRETYNGAALQQSGMAKTLANEQDAWREHAIGLLANYARLAKRPFSMDEFRLAWDELGYAEPHHPNVWGAVTNVAAKRKLIVPTGEWVRSERPSAHNRHTRLWRAL